MCIDRVPSWVSGGKAGMSLRGPGRGAGDPGMDWVGVGLGRRMEGFEGRSPGCEAEMGGWMDWGRWGEVRCVDGRGGVVVCAASERMVRDERLNEIQHRHGARSMQHT